MEMLHGADNHKIDEYDSLYSVRNAGGNDSGKRSENEIFILIHL